jgi:hypothetical protein
MQPIKNTDAVREQLRRLKFIAQMWMSKAVRYRFVTGLARASRYSGLEDSFESNGGNARTSPPKPCKRGVSMEDVSYASRACTRVTVS